MLLGTCPRAVVRCVLCALSGIAAPGGRCCYAPVRVRWLLPAACLSGVPRAPARCAAPRLVRSLSVLWSAFPTPWSLSPPLGLVPPALLGGCAVHAEAGRQPGSLCLPPAPAEAGALGSLRVVPVPGPAMGLSLAGPSGVGLGLRALRWFACVDPVTDPSGFSYSPSFDNRLGRCTGAVSCGRKARVPCVCACAIPSWPGRVGRPPGRVLVRLTFSSCRFVTDPTARALACCGGGMRVPGGGASCLGVGRPGTGALPPPTSRPFRRAAGAHYPLAVAAGDAGVGTRHQPHSAHSCVLWGRHEASRGGRLLPGCGASGDGRSPTPDLSSVRACGRGPLPTGCGCGGCGRGDQSPTPQRAPLRSVGAA